MKNCVGILLGFALTTSFFSLSQSKNFDPSNARDGETVEYCFQHKKMNALRQNPAFVQSQIEDDAIRAHEANETPKATLYKIPVVFHVLHNGGAENISDEQIQDALFVMNRDFRKQNADTANIHTDFDGMPADIEVEFVLATKAPNGTCFRGITRTLSAMSFQGDDGNAQVDAIVAGNDVYNGQWAGNKYMNIFICGEIGGAAGYTMTPSNWIGTVMDNGIWILSQYVGSIGTGSVGTSRALTHEVGHWLNLEHTWGPNNNPGNASSCGDDDYIQDTPNCIGVTSCNINSNSCNSDDAYWGMAMRDNVENYMDYSYCSKMYSEGQKSRMRSALTSSVGGRNNLWTVANLNFTGTNGNPTLCKADFKANKTEICVGESVTFSDETYNAATGWTWSFPSGTPSTSPDQNPIVTYSTPGVYQVSLTSTDGTTNDSEVKTAYITVLSETASIPFYESFESYSSLTGNSNWKAQETSNNDFVLTTPTALTGSKCVKLGNYGQAAGSTDELLSSPVDLSNVTAGTGGVTLSFRYAYRKKTTADYEYLKVFLSNNCGDTWVQRKTIGGSQLGSVAVTSDWTPSGATDWTTVHMTNVTSEFWIENFRYKFKFESDGGNNFFLDDINIYPGSPSDAIVLGMDEIETVNNLSLFPNPAADEVNVQFNLSTAQEVQVQVQDLFGKVINQHLVKANTGSNLVLLNTTNLAAGVYFINVKTGSTQQVLQLIVE